MVVTSRVWRNAFVAQGNPKPPTRKEEALAPLGDNQSITKDYHKNDSITPLRPASFDKHCAGGLNHAMRHVFFQTGSFDKQVDLTRHLCARPARREWVLSQDPYLSTRTVGRNVA